MAQMLVDFGRAEANLERARGMIAHAAAERCDFVVLPEVMDLGWPYDPASDLAEPIPGPRSAALAAEAARHGIYVVSGLTERAGDRVHNAAVFFSRDGRLLHVHRKINTLTHVEGIYAIGDRLGVVETEFGAVGIDICADSFVEAIPRALCHMGASLILSPSAWAVPGDHDNAKTPYGGEWLNADGKIARLYDGGLGGVSNVGPVTFGAWSGWRCIGRSLAMGPGGKVLAHGPYGVDAETLMTVDVPLVPRPARGGEWWQHLEKKDDGGLKVEERTLARWETA